MLTRHNTASESLGKRFGDDADDWELLARNIPAVLKAWHAKGYKIALISNQLGVGKGKVDKKTVRSKCLFLASTLTGVVTLYPLF